MRIPILSKWLKSRRDKSMTLRELFDFHYRPQRLPDASEASLHCYDVAFRLLEKFLGREARVGDFTNEKMAEFQAHRLTTVKPQTLKQNMDCIFALWRYSFRKNLVRVWPDLKALRLEHKTPRALTEKELERVWAAIQAETKPVAVSCSPLKEVPGRLWWSGLFMLAMETGERLNALMSVCEGDIDLEDRWVMFRAESRKGGREDNLKDISPECADAIGTLVSFYSRRTARTNVFRWSMNRGSVFTRMGKIMQAAGLEDCRDLKFHCLRRTVATHIACNGGDATKMLGHSNPAITKRSYLDTRIAKPKSILPLLPRPWANGESNGHVEKPTEAPPAPAPLAPVPAGDVVAFVRRAQPRPTSRKVIERRKAVAALLTENPNLSRLEIAERLGVCTRTVDGDLQRMRDAAKQAEANGST